MKLALQTLRFLYARSLSLCDKMLRWHTHFNYSPMRRATTNTRLVIFETAVPFVPYISALKDGVLRHKADKAITGRPPTKLTELLKPLLSADRKYPAGFSYICRGPLPSRARSLRIRNKIRFRPQSPCLRMSIGTTSRRNHFPPSPRQNTTGKPCSPAICSKPLRRMCDHACS